MGTFGNMQLKHFGSAGETACLTRATAIRLRATLSSQPSKLRPSPMTSPATGETGGGGGRVFCCEELVPHLRDALVVRGIHNDQNEVGLKNVVPVLRP